MCTVHDADARDRPQASPAGFRVGRLEVDAAGGDLARGAGSARASARARGRRTRAAPGPGPATTPGGADNRARSAAARSGVRAGTTEPPFDRRPPLVLDQLLAHRPGERLERLGAARRPAGRVGVRTLGPISGSQREPLVERRAGPGRRRVARRMRSMPWAAAASERARAPNGARSGAVCATRTSTGSPSWCSRRVRARRRAGAALRPSRHGAGGRSPAGVTSRRRSTLRHDRRADARPRAANGCRRSGRAPLAADCVPRRRPRASRRPAFRPLLSATARRWRRVTSPITAAPASGTATAATAAACTAGVVIVCGSRAGRSRAGHGLRAHDARLLGEHRQRAFRHLRGLIATRSQIVSTAGGAHRPSVVSTADPQWVAQRLDAYRSRGAMAPGEPACSRPSARTA